MSTSTIAASTTRSLTSREFSLFRDLIYREAGIALSPSKHQLVESRLGKRLRALGLATFSEYFEYATRGETNGQERLQLINCLTTNKTDFFREIHHFQFLQQTLFPAIEHRANETGERRIRIWSAACSTGEEPYSLAMTVLDYFGPMAVNGWDIRILASDVDTEVLAHASAGRYEADRLEETPAEIRKRYFTRTAKTPNADFQVRPDLQELITFRRINFVDSVWPVQTHFDIIFCRNVMIYFDEATQDRLLSRFADVLVPEGHLCIGHSESILRLDNVFRSLGNTIYRLRPGIGAAARALAQKNVTLNKSTISDKPLGSVKQNSEPVNSSPAPRASTGTLKNAPASPSGVPTECADLPVQSLIVGELRASAVPVKLTTLVGSCITVCLYDPVSHIGGMNHFMLPQDSGSGRSSATYGIYAMELLINQLMKLGANRRRLEAKVFGGANVLGRPLAADSPHNIGESNLRFALSFLKTEQIPIRAQSVGGTCGRQVHFLPHTGQVFIRETRVPERTETPGSGTHQPAVPVGSVELFIDAEHHSEKERSWVRK